MNIVTMLSSSRGSKKLTIGNVIKFSNYKSSVLHTELRFSTLVLFIIIRNSLCISVIGKQLLSGQISFCYQYVKVTRKKKYWYFNVN